MKQILKLILVLSIFTSCSSSRNNFKTTEDKELLQAVKKYHKNPEKTELKQTLVQLYEAASKLHLDKIEVNKSLTDADRWEKIIGEYEALQQLHEVIYESDIARKAVDSKDYSAEIISAKQNGAEAFYQQGLDELSEETRESAKAAYYSFKKANKLVPGFKDATRQMDVAFENSIVNVVINPVKENYYNSSYSNGYNSRYGYSHDNFVTNLVRDLGGNYNSKNLPARFYTDYDARRESINPDWIVDLEWVNLDIPRPRTQHYTRNVSRQIQDGTDTSGRPIYRTVSGTLQITKSEFTARGDIEVRITEVGTRRSIAYNRYNESYNWEEEYATFSGDTRALSGNDATIVNRGNYRNIRQDEVMEELYRQVYSQVKNRIYSAASW